MPCRRGRPIGIIEIDQVDLDLRFRDADLADVVRVMAEVFDDP